MEYRGWAGAEGGIALELLQAKENEASLSPMQWSSHTLSFKVSIWGHPSPGHQEQR